MKYLITPILICLMIMSDAAAENPKVSVAKVDYNEIDDLLIKVVLRMDGNEEARGTVPSQATES